MAERVGGGPAALYIFLSIFCCRLYLKPEEVRDRPGLPHEADAAWQEFKMKRQTTYVCFTSTPRQIKDRLKHATAERETQPTGKHEAHKITTETSAAGKKNLEKSVKF